MGPREIPRALSTPSRQIFFAPIQTLMCNAVLMALRHQTNWTSWARRLNMTSAGGPPKSAKYICGQSRMGVP